jgi:hypothetical protein
MSIWNILLTFGIFYDHWVHFVFICYIFSGLGIIYQEKSGNPGCVVHAIAHKNNLSRSLVATAQMSTEETYDKEPSRLRTT